MKPGGSDSPDFIDRLAQDLSGDPLREKTLLAPSLRVGRQWLDLAAARAGGVANCRVTTIRRLALDLALPDLRRQGLRPASRQEKTRRIGLSLAGLKKTGRGYFSRLPASLALAETILAAIEEVEQALPGREFPKLKSVSPPEKAGELARLSRDYHSGLVKERLAGAGIVLAAALAAAGKPNPARPLLAIPEPVVEDLAAGERELLTAWPEADRTVIPEPEGAGEAKLEIFTADSVMNEAREVFRRLQAAEIPLEQAEAICLDEAVYAPALCAAAREVFGGGLEDLPLTCALGLPAGSSRPARLLLAWLEWRREGLPPEGLARMAASGLLDGIWRQALPGLEGWEVAAYLRSLPLTGAPDNYRRILGRNLRPEEDSRVLAASARLAGFLEKILPAAASDSLSVSGNAVRTLREALELLRLPDSGVGKLDAYAAAALIEAIEAWLPLSDWPGFDARAWLAGLASGLQVMGMGPRPGRLHVSGLFSGGHSVRGAIFVLGLDDSRFPGQPRQNPVLTDRERDGVYSRLRPASYWPRRREAALERLLVRARGRLFLSHARREDGAGRELFPALFLQKIRNKTVSGPEATAALVPEKPEKRLNGRDDWLGSLLAQRRNRLTPGQLSPWFPQLAQGETALAARASRVFTEYDGRVPEAGKDFLSRPETLSPTDLELLAACPLEFFFRRILGIRPPERGEIQPGRWLSGAERGNLLHRIFQDFAENTRADEPDAEKWRPLLAELLVKALEKARREFPAADSLVRLREERTLAEACDIFLAGELKRRREGRPVWLELSFGKSLDHLPPPWNRAGEIVL